MSSKYPYVYHYFRPTSNDMHADMLGREILMSKVDPRTVRVNIFIISPRARRVLFMFLCPNVRSVVSIGKICQEFKSGTLTNPK